MIDQQLLDMYAGGQRRLRIGISHARSFSTGTVSDSNHGNLPVQDRQNLANLLETARAVGFVEFLIVFHPVASNDPASWAPTATWSSFHEGYFQENWNLIVNIMPILRASGVPFRVDLGNELSAPKGHSGVWTEYARKLWTNFNIVFTRAETVGFSVPADATLLARIQNFQHIYGHTDMPYVLDFHIYDNAYSRFMQINYEMRSRRLPQGLIIGETYYNDATAAQDLANASAVSGREIFYVTQWPLTRTSACPDVNTVPIHYQNFISSGH